MGTMAWLILGLALGLGSPFMILQVQRRRDMARAGGPGTGRGGSRGERVRPGNPFAAVSIRPCADSPCAPVLRMNHIRFLAVRAPPLPVPGCDREHCGCRYVRHADRRASGGDRRDPFARFGGLIPTVGKDQRQRDDRRKSGKTH